MIKALITRMALERKVVIGITLILTFFALILLGVVRDRANEFYKTQQSIAEVATQKVAVEIDKIFSNKRKLVKTFLEDNKILLSKIIKDFDDEELYDRFNEKLKRYFSDYFTSSIANSKGQLQRISLGDIGEVCISDMKTYLDSGKQQIRIHPNVTLFHYDILVDIRVDNKDFIFITTFTSEQIASLLHASSPVSHNLFIVNKDKAYLIEVTEKGSRDTFERKSELSLSKEEQKRILAIKKIDESFWHVVDFNDIGLFDDYKTRLIRDYLIIFFVFMVFTLFMGKLVLVGIKRKEQLQTVLENKNLEVKALNDTLEKLTITDDLTGLYNRRFLDNEIEKKWNEASRLNIPFNVAMIDIDFFKQYNDCYGHLEGDHCLTKVAQLCLENFRRTNEFGVRYGGEEFIFINLGDTQESFLKRLEKLLEVLAEADIKHEGSKIDNKVTLSIGIASTENKAYQQVNDIIKSADNALYKAKNSGRNQIIVTE